jgi:hypothetical protein
MDSEYVDERGPIEKLNDVANAISNEWDRMRDTIDPYQDAQAPRSHDRGAMVLVAKVVSR